MEFTNWIADHINSSVCIEDLSNEQLDELITDMDNQFDVRLLQHVYRIARSYLSPKDPDFNDAVQISMERIWKNQCGELGSPRNPKTTKSWAQTLVRNAIFSLRRNRKKDFPIIDPHDLSQAKSDHGDLEEKNELVLSDLEKGSLNLHDLNNSEKIALINVLVGELPKLSKEVFTMKYLYDMKVTEIAKKLDIPIGTVKSRLSKSLSIIRSKLEDFKED
jgi:RNA polymerase sigma factor (sigma-70 family)